MNLLYKNIDCHGLHVPLISKEVFDVIVKNESAINSAIDYKRDYLIDYFGFKTLERAYLIKINNKCIERPQDMWMRVSIGIHGNDIEKAIETYKKALAIKSDYVDAYNNMGAAFNEQDKLEDAIMAYNKAITIKPDNPEANNKITNKLKEKQHGS